MTTQDQVTVMCIVFVPFAAFSLLLAAMQGLESLIDGMVARHKEHRRILRHWNDIRQRWKEREVKESRLKSNYAGRRANATPRVGQVWKSSDPRRLSAFRIMHVDQPWLVDECVVAERHVDIEMITNPGITGRTARTLTLARFQVLGPKGYTRVS